MRWRSTDKSSLSSGCEGFMPGGEYPNVVTYAHDRSVYSGVCSFVDIPVHATRSPGMVRLQGLSIAILSMAVWLGC